MFNMHISLFVYQSVENSRKVCHQYPVTCMQRSDYCFERSNISFLKNKLDGVDLNYINLNYGVRTDGMIKE